MLLCVHVYAYDISDIIMCLSHTTPTYPPQVKVAQFAASTAVCKSATGGLP